MAGYKSRTVIPLDEMNYKRDGDILLKRNTHSRPNTPIFVQFQSLQDSLGHTTADCNYLASYTIGLNKK